MRKLLCMALVMLPAVALSEERASPLKEVDTDESRIRGLFGYIDMVERSEPGMAAMTLTESVGLDPMTAGRVVEHARKAMTEELAAAEDDRQHACARRAQLLDRAALVAELQKMHAAEEDLQQKNAAAVSAILNEHDYGRLQSWLKGEWSMPNSGGVSTSTVVFTEEAWAEVLSKIDPATALRQLCDNPPPPG